WGDTLAKLLQGSTVPCEAATWWLARGNVCIDDAFGAVQIEDRDVRRNRTEFVCMISAEEIRCRHGQFGAGTPDHVCCFARVIARTHGYDGRADLQNGECRDEPRNSVGRQNGDP